MASSAELLALLEREAARPLPNLCRDLLQTGEAEYLSEGSCEDGESDAGREGSSDDDEDDEGELGSETSDDGGPGWWSDDGDDGEDSELFLEQARLADEGASDKSEEEDGTDLFLQALPVLGATGYLSFVSWLTQLRRLSRGAREFSSCRLSVHSPHFCLK
jgi:hypothetical protein